MIKLVTTESIINAMNAMAGENQELMLRPAQRQLQNCKCSTTSHYNEQIYSCNQNCTVRMGTRGGEGCNHERIAAVIPNTGGTTTSIQGQDTTKHNYLKVAHVLGKQVPSKWGVQQGRGKAHHRWESSEFRDVS
jgi:hypothetical protein